MRRPGRGGTGYQKCCTLDSEFLTAFQFLRQPNFPHPTERCVESEAKPASR